MGEQFLDLFAAGGYALAGRLMLGLGGASMAWLFYLLATAGIVYSIINGAAAGNPGLWLRHLMVVALAALLITVPQRIDLRTLTYAAPGRIEALMGSSTGAAPHLTYAVERLGTAVAVQVRGLIGARPALAIPGVVGQVADLVNDPAILDDRQLRANLELWRRRVVPQMLQDDPALAAQLRGADLLPLLLNPAVDDARFCSAATLARVHALHAALAGTRFDLVATAQAQDSVWRRITDAAGADAWLVVGTSGTDGGDAGDGDSGSDAVAAGSAVSIRFAQTQARPDAALDGAPLNLLLSDAQSRGQAVAQDMIQLQPDAFAATPIATADALYRHLAGSILVVAGNAYLASDARRTTLGNLCQRAGDAACRTAQAPLPATSALLRVPDRDDYNPPGARIWLKQSLATLLLTIASVLAGALSSLVVAVLPFLLGVAKTMAILLSVIGVWLLLWPGRLQTALAWIVGPVAFVGLWSVLFSVWVEIEAFLSALASIVGSSDNGSWSAGRIMSIALSLGYLGLPTLALHILFGTAHGALSHGGQQLEAALKTGMQHSPRLLATARRWAWRAPLVQRINRRIYARFGLGVQPARRRSPARPRPAPAPAASTAGAAGAPAAAASPTPGSTPGTGASGAASSAPEESSAAAPRKRATRKSTAPDGDGSASPPARRRRKTDPPA